MFFSVPHKLKFVFAFSAGNISSIWETFMYVLMIVVRMSWSLQETYVKALDYNLVLSALKLPWLYFVIK